MIITRCAAGKISLLRWSIESIDLSFVSDKSVSRLLPALDLKSGKRSIGFETNCQVSFFFLILTILTCSLTTVELSKLNIFKRSTAKCPIYREVSFMQLLHIIHSRAQCFFFFFFFFYMQQIVNGALFYCPAFIINGTEPSTQRVDESSNRRTILFWDFIAEIEISD